MTLDVTPKFESPLRKITVVWDTFLSFFLTITKPDYSYRVHVPSKPNSNGMNDTHGEVSNARRKHALSIVQ